MDVDKDSELLLLAVALLVVMDVAVTVTGAGGFVVSFTDDDDDGNKDGDGKDAEVNEVPLVPAFVTGCSDEAATRISSMANTVRGLDDNPGDGRDRRRAQKICAAVLAFPSL